MPKFFCDYCDVYLTHDSMSVRKAHNSGRNHLRNVIEYYQQIGHEKAQSVIDDITNSYSAEGQASANPMNNYPGMGAPGVGGGPPGGGGFGPPPPGFGGPPPPPGGFGGAGGFPPGMPPPPGGQGMPPPPGGFPPLPQGMPPGFPPPPQGMPPTGPPSRGPPGGFQGSPPQGMPFPPPGGFPPNFQGGPPGQGPPPGMGGHGPPGR